MNKIIAIAVALAFSGAALAQAPKAAEPAKAATKEAVVKKGKRKEEKDRVEDKAKPVVIKNEGKRKGEPVRTEKK